MSEEVKTESTPDRELIPTADQVEQIILEKDKEASEKPGHVLDTYAGFFKVYGPVFDRTIDMLGKKSLARVMKLLIKYPIEEEHLKPMNKAEKDLFRIGHELLISKYMLIIHTAGEEMQRQEKEKAELEVKKKEEVNGTEVKTDSSV